jgi:acyl phosphate:glycerol-3-phosphate acyltransferase
VKQSRTAFGAVATNAKPARRWTFWQTLLAFSLAFAGGCISASRVASFFADPTAKERLAREKPGTATVYRILGRRAGMAVFTADALKGLLPPVVGRAAGAGPLAVDALMLAPLAGHITVGGGRGVATLAGSVLAADPPGFAITLPIWLIPSARQDHARGVMVACLLFPVVRLLLGRGKARTAMGAGVPLLLVYGRLRGPGWPDTRWTPQLLWWRLSRDAEPPEQAHTL